MKNIEIYNFLNGIYPIETACDFDNPGFLVGDRNADTSGVLVALDCDLAAVCEAERRDCNLIVSHHPVIFDPLRAVTEESVVYALIKNGISVISMHTNLDIGIGGVADCVCRAAGLESVREYSAADGFLLRSAEISPISPKAFAERLKNAFGAPVRYTEGGKDICRCLICPGSGGEYTAEAVSSGFDALITGDVKHNQFVAAENAGLSLFDIGHFNGEDAVVEPLAALLRKEFTGLSVSVYHSDRLKWAY